MTSGEVFAEINGTRKMKNKVVSQLKKEIRNAELINKVVAEERDKSTKENEWWCDCGLLNNDERCIECGLKRKKKTKPTKEDLIGVSKEELINEYEVFE